MKTYGYYTFAEVFVALNLSRMCARKAIDLNLILVITHFKPKNKLNSK